MSTVARTAFHSISALLFIASALATICLCGSMSGGMPMAGGWTMSMAWMRMSGQTWVAAAASFMAMWVVMMMAMMLPSLVLTLSSYRQGIAIAGAGYFFVWAVIGAVVYPIGLALVAVEMRWPLLARCVPTAAGVVVLIAGSLQLTAWKARHLLRCREASDCGHTTWRRGIRLGLNCTLCCASFTMILLVTGVMNLAAMAAVGTAITAERFAPRPESVARGTGVVAIAVGGFALARALIWSG